MVTLEQHIRVLAIAGISVFINLLIVLFQIFKYLAKKYPDLIFEPEELEESGEFEGSGESDV